MIYGLVMNCSAMCSASLYRHPCFHFTHLCGVSKTLPERNIRYPITKRTSVVRLPSPLPFFDLHSNMSIIPHSTTFGTRETFRPITITLFTPLGNLNFPRITSTSRTPENPRTAIISTIHFLVCPTIFTFWAFALFLTVDLAFSSKQDISALDSRRRHLQMLSRSTGRFSDWKR